MKRPTIIALLLCAMPLLLSLLMLSSCGPGQTVQFGVILPLTGESGVYAGAVQRGIDLAYANLASDPDLSFTVELLIEDSEGDPTRAAELLQQVFDAGALAAIGGVTSAEALAMAAVADEEERILLSPSASSPALSGISTFFYRIFPDSVAEAISMASFVEEKLKSENVVVVRADTTYGDGAAASFVEHFGNGVGEVLTFPPGTEDVSEVVEQVVQRRPDAVYVAAAGSDLALFIRSLRARGYNGERDWILASSALANPAVLAEAGPAADRTFYTQTPFNVEDEEEPVASFVAAYEAKFAEKPDLYTAYGYDALTVLVYALKEGGGPFPNEFQNGMRSISNFSGVTGNIQFRESGDVQKFMRIYFISEGVSHDYDDWMEARRERLQDEMNRLRRERERLLLENR